MASPRRNSSDDDIYDDYFTFGLYSTFPIATPFLDESEESSASDEYFYPRRIDLHEWAETYARRPSDPIVQLGIYDIMDEPEQDDFFNFRGTMTRSAIDDPTLLGNYEMWNNFEHVVNGIISDNMQTIYGLQNDRSRRLAIRNFTRDTIDDILEAPMLNEIFDSMYNLYQQRGGGHDQFNFERLILRGNIREWINERVEDEN